MRQILLLILLFFAGSWLARKLRQAQDHAHARTGRGAGYGGGQAGPGADTRSLPEPMVRCAECGVHAPKGDAVAGGRRILLQRRACAAPSRPRERHRCAMSGAR